MHPNVKGVLAYGEAIYAALAADVLALDPAPNAPRADLDLERTTIPFGTVPVGELRIRTVTVTNVGEVPLTLEVTAQSGPISWPARITTLRPGQEAALTVRFLPPSAGEHEATLNITSASPGSPHRIEISGRAAGGATHPN